MGSGCDLFEEEGPHSSPDHRGAGFIGSHLCDALVERGDDVVLLDDLSAPAGGRTSSTCSGSPPGPARRGLDLRRRAGRRADVRGRQLLSPRLGRRRAADLRPPARLAAPQRPRRATSSSARPLATTSASLYTSTSEIYGKDSVGALHEESDRLLGPPQLGRWSYANAKVFGEMLALGHAARARRPRDRRSALQHRGPAADRRLRHGPSVASCARRSSGDDLTVFGDGTQSRCFAHVLDVIAALLARPRERTMRSARSSTSARRWRSPSRSWPSA